MEKRLGFVGIIVEDRKRSAPLVNKILSDYGDHILARVGLPYKQRQCNVITLTVEMTMDDIGGLTGKLGSIPGVTVKAALGKV
ncbi:MAG: CopG family transcriptional regulator [Candidatus Omnitrophica bacterium]|nr:CopG family transcriptional regulator [Candidatus Omnitrophota bacterium]